jgi:predicted TIM-barrel fold metal-dependent hydrolase
MTRAATAADPSTWSDAHLHLWDSSLLAPPWLAAAPRFAGSFGLERYRGDGGVGGALVLVEADVAPRDRAREAELLSSWARAEGRTHAVVAGIEPGGAGFAEAMRAAREVPAVTGSRRVLHGGDRAFGGAAFVRDLRALGAAGISADLCVRWTDLALVEHCAREAPEATIVLDHLGNPPLRAGWDSTERAEWQRLVARVAACTNTVVKWSAMFENAGRAIDSLEARGWFEWSLECFGPDRVLWGSNWPVCFADAPLARWLECSAELAAGLAPGEQDAVFRANAARIYRC